MKNSPHPENEIQTSSNVSAFNKVISSIKKALTIFWAGFTNLISKIRKALSQKKESESNPSSTPQEYPQEDTSVKQQATSREALKEKPIEQIPVPQQRSSAALEQESPRQPPNPIENQPELAKALKALEESKERRQQLERDEAEAQKAKAQRVAAEKIDAQRVQHEKEELAQRQKKAFNEQAAREAAQKKEQEAIAQEKQRQEQEAAAEKARAQSQAAAKAAKLKELPNIHYQGRPGEMRAVEQAIIAILEKIEQDKDKSYDVKAQNESAFQKLVNEYQQSSFGHSTEAFLNDPTMKLYLSKLHENKQSIPYFPLWMLIEHYSLETSETNKADYLKRIEKQVQTIRKARENYMSMPSEWHFKLKKPTQPDDNFIKNVYLTDDPKLTQIFIENLNIPRIGIFQGGLIPAAIQKKYNEIEKIEEEEEKRYQELQAAEAAKKAAAEKAVADAKKDKLEELAKLHYMGKPGEMRFIEKNIIASIQKNEQGKTESYDIRTENEEAFREQVKAYQKFPFGTSTQAFLNDPTMKLYFSELHKPTELYMIEAYLRSDEIVNFRLWMLIEHYILEKSEIKKTNYLNRIANELHRIHEEIYAPSGQGLFNQLDENLIKNAYLSNDPKLINLFINAPSTKLPIPGIEVFEGGPIPTVIQQRHDEMQRTTAAFQQRLPHGEAFVTHFQRRVRSKQRQRKEINRLAQHSSVTQRKIKVDGVFKYRTQGEIREEITKVLADSNTPYIPTKSSPEFAKILVEAASKVKLFDTIRHQTSASHLNLILDEGLKGHKTLLEQGRPFKKGALHNSDLEGGGDANVICFGVQEIVANATQVDSIEITLNIDKIKPNPCMFYKQRDFGYSTKTIHETSVAGAFYFTHGDGLRCSQGSGFTNLQIKNSSKEIEAFSEMPTYFFMAYNVSKIHQILTLNFFRFIDTLRAGGSGSPDEHRSKRIYTSLEKIFKEGGETALIEELTKIGKAMTRTAEVDFYGTYKLDFSAVQSIKSKSCTLELSNFIAELQKGNMNLLIEFQSLEKGIPNLFKSYRFLDYLLSKPQVETYPENILEELNRIKATCPKPAYLGAQYAQAPAAAKAAGTALTPETPGLAAIKTTPKK